MKEALSDEIIGSMLRALCRDCTPSCADRLNTLDGLRESPNFDFTLSLLCEEDVQCVQTVFRQLREDLAVDTVETEEAAAAGVEKPRRKRSKAEQCAQFEALKHVYAVVL